MIAHSMIPMSLEIIRRSEWVDPAFPFSGPPADPKLWQAVIYHYPGGNVRSGSRDELISLVRRMHQNYLADPRRRHSLGYGFVVGTAGHVAEVRGLDLRNAANDGTDSVTGVSNYNPLTVSIQFAVAGEAPATNAQLARAVELHWMIERHCGRDLRVEGHGDKDATPCPGAGIRAQLPALARAVRVPRATPTPLPEGSEMKTMCVNRNGGYWLWDGVRRTPLQYPVDGPPSPGGDFMLLAQLLWFRDRGVQFGPDNPAQPGIPQPVVLESWVERTFDSSPTS